MFSAMGGVATQCVLNFAKGTMELALPLPYLSKWSQETGAIGNGTTLQLFLLAGSSSSHLFSIMTMLWDLIVATSNLPQRLFLASREFHWTSLSLV